MKIERAKREVWAKVDRPAYTADISTPQHTETNFIDRSQLERGTAQLAEFTARVGLERDVAKQQNLTTLYKQIREEYIKDLQLCKTSEEVEAKRKEFDKSIENIKKSFIDSAEGNRNIQPLLAAWQDKVGRHLDAETNIQQEYVRNSLVMAEKESAIIDDVSRNVNLFLGRFMNKLDTKDIASSKNSDERQKLSKRATMLKKDDKEAEELFEKWMDSEITGRNGKRFKVLSEEERSKYKQLFMNMLDKARVQADIYGKGTDYYDEHNYAKIPISKTGDPAGALKRLEATDKNGEYIYYKGLVGEERLKYLYEAKKWAGVGWGSGGGRGENKFYDLLTYALDSNRQEYVPVLLNLARKNKLKELNSLASDIMGENQDFKGTDVGTGLNMWDNQAEKTTDPGILKARKEVEDVWMSVRADTAFDNTEKGSKGLSISYTITKNGTFENGEQDIKNYIAEISSRGLNTIKQPTGNDVMKKENDSTFIGLLRLLGTSASFAGETETHNNFLRSTTKLVVAELDNFNFSDGGRYKYGDRTYHPLSNMKTAFGELDKMAGSGNYTVYINKDDLKTFVVQAVGTSVVANVWNEEGRLRNDVITNSNMYNPSIQDEFKSFVRWYKRENPENKEQQPFVGDYINYLLSMRKIEMEGDIYNQKWKNNPSMGQERMTSPTIEAIRQMYR